MSNHGNCCFGKGRTRVPIHAPMHSQRHHHLARFSFGFLASPGIVASGKSGIRMSNAEDLRPELDRRVKDVTEVLDVPEPAAMVLLSQYNWSKEELLEAYMANADKLLKAHGVYRRCGHALNPPSNRTKSCAICYDDDVDEMLAMPCGHEFCLDCWHDFSVAAIAEGPVCINTTCPHAGCPEKVTAIEFERSLGKQHVDYQKFLTYQIRSFVESNGLSRWCPGAGCERVACAVSAAAMESEGSVATCDTCATSFCLRCGQEPHAPASCPEIALWMEKCRNESETANWILANTKSCPKCMSRIEKNQGCNHMSKCRRNSKRITPKVSWCSTHVPFSNLVSFMTRLPTL